MKNPIAIITAAALIALPFTVSAQQSKKSDSKSAEGKASMSKEDSKRFSDIAEANMAEVEAGKAAQGKAQAKEVKDFAQHMVDDHGKMLEEGKQLAQSKGLQPPADLKREHKSAMEKMSKLSGEEFDRAYMKQMVEDHQKTLKLVQDTAKNAKDPELKAMAEKAAPNVQHHLEMARGIQSAAAGSSGKGGKSGGKAASSSEGGKSAGGSGSK